MQAVIMPSETVAKICDSMTATGLQKSSSDQPCKTSRRPIWTKAGESEPMATKQNLLSAAQWEAGITSRAKHGQEDDARKLRKSILLVPEMSMRAEKMMRISTPMQTRQKRYLLRASIELHALTLQ